MCALPLVPGQPMNLRAEAKSETSIGLSWSAPRQESVIKYELLFREGDRGREVPGLCGWQGMSWVGPARQAPRGPHQYWLVTHPCLPTLPIHSLPTLPHSAHVPSLSPSISVSTPPSLFLCPCVCPPALGPSVLRWGEPSTQPQPFWWRTSNPIRSMRSGWLRARRRAWAPSPRLCASARCRPVRVSRRFVLGGGGCNSH